MKKQKVTINCSLCNYQIVETSDFTQTIDLFVQKNNLTEIEIKNKDYPEKGYLCNSCFSFLSIKNNVEKVTKKTVRFGSSSGVLLPRSWLNKKAIVMLIE